LAVVLPPALDSDVPLFMEWTGNAGDSRATQNPGRVLRPERALSLIENPTAPANSHHVTSARNVLVPNSQKMHSRISGSDIERTYVPAPLAPHGPAWKRGRRFGSRSRLRRSVKTARLVPSMHELTLFPFAEYWWAYGLFVVFVLAMLALDLGVFHRQAHVVHWKEALGWTTVWVCLAGLFAWGLWAYGHWKFPQDLRLLEAGITAAEAGTLANRSTLEFVTGFVVEKALSVDNIFVFVLVFRYFGIPAALQHRVLFFGIIGALFFRVLFISLGTLLLQFHWALWLFGGFLILTGIKIFFAPEKPLAPERNPLIKLLRRLLPVTPRLEGQRFFVRDQGILHMTPLFVALVFIELTDIVFAVDSVPAVFAVTREPFLVFTSNVFAILGLRALFFLLADVMHRFHFLKHGLGVILVFVGLKMVWLNDAFGGKFPIGWSLGIIGGVLAAAILVSLLTPPTSVVEEQSSGDQR
jgi:tellurite resistance protein TerC